MYTAKVHSDGPDKMVVESGGSVELKNGASPIGMPGIFETAIAFDDSGKSLGAIPDGAKIYSMSIVVTTAFNGTTPTYDVGYAADADALVDGVSLGSAGVVGVTAPSATVGQWANGVTSGALIGTFAGGGSNTAGVGKLRIAYYL